MATNKTDFLNLNDWVGTDQFRREEINENFRKIDVKAKEHSDGLVAKADKSEVATLTAQLADKVKQLNSQFINAMFPPSPLVATKGDGVTDDADALQAMVNYLSDNGGGTIFLPKAIYKVTHAITWKSKVSLIGAGAGKSIIKPYGTGYAAIMNLGTIGSPLVNCTFEKFEVDGINQGDNTLPYNISEKAIFILFMKQGIFRDLYLHDTPATALGADYLTDTIMENIVVERAGRLFGINGGGAGGGSGIGIGTGAWQYENLKVVNCEARDCGNYGIFVEVQRDGVHENISRGIRIIGCNTSGNARAGICDKGVDGLFVSNCNMHDNKYGFELLDGGINGNFDNNNVHNNTNEGVRVDQNVTANAISYGYRFSNNRIYANGKHGINIITNDRAIDDISIKDNVVHSNQNVGILIETTTTGLANNLHVVRNKVYNNGLANTAAYNHGVRIGLNLVNPYILDNKCYDTQTTKTQDTGIFVVSGKTITNGALRNNDCRGNKTESISITGATMLGNAIAENNNDLNYKTTVLVVTQTASPMTYTADYRPEVLYVIGTGITIAIGGQNVITNESTVTVPLQARQTVTITYSTIVSIKKQVL